MSSLRSWALLAVGLGLSGCAGVGSLPEQYYTDRPGTAARSEPAPQAAPERREARRPQARSVAPTLASPSATLPSNAAPVVSSTPEAEFVAAEPAPMARTRAPQASANASDLAPSPKVGTPEWNRQEAENERKERALKQKIQSICRGC